MKEVNMQTLASLNSPSKLLAVLALPMFVGLSLDASAEDLRQGAPGAPCDVLKQIIENRTIYNNSNFHFKVRFESKASQLVLFGLLMQVQSSIWTSAQITEVSGEIPEKATIVL